MHLVGFITKRFVAMHGHMNVKLMNCMFVTHKYWIGRRECKASVTINQADTEK